MTAMKVGVLLPAPGEDLGGWLAGAAAFDTAGANALWIDAAGDLDPLVVTAALAALTYRSLLVTAVPVGAGDRMVETVVRLSRGRFVDAAAFPEDQWERIAWSGGRAAWRSAVAEAAERGAGGLLVPAGPQLLDMLRNPNDPGERQDLQLAQG
jgi:hypothetical protein